MPRLTSSNPSYRRHKASGQAVVTLGGQDVYLGPYGTAASKREYDRVVGEWLARGRQLATPAESYTVAMLILAFWAHAQTHYRGPDGEPTSEVGNYRDVLKPLRRLYGHTLVSAFGPLSLKALRAEMIKLGWCRTNINRQIARVRQVFKWGVENELVPPSVHQGLSAVAGLRAGRSDARESEPVKPVPVEMVAQTLPHLSNQVAGMVRLHLLTGMRPGEVIALRGCDLDTRGNVWTYRPERHKTQHHGHERVVYFGPQAQEVVRPFLKPDLTACLFAPADAERERREARHEVRKMPLSCGNRPGTNRSRKPRKTPGTSYTVESYCKAVRRVEGEAGGGEVDDLPADSMTHDGSVLLCGTLPPDRRLWPLVDQLRRLHESHYGSLGGPAVATFTIDTMRQLAAQGGEAALARLKSRGFASLADDKMNAKSPSRRDAA